MKLLLDTHTAIWLLDDAARIGTAARRQLTDPSNTVLLSAVSVWEIAIKSGLGKLTPPDGYLDRLLIDGGIEPLVVSVAHAERVRSLPPHHRDPFDRMLVAQASAEGAVLVSRDPAFARYDVPVIW